MQLSDLPCLWLSDPPHDPAITLRLARSLPGHSLLAPDDLSARAAWSAAQTASHILVLTDRCLPDPMLTALAPDQLLLDSGLIIGLMARNAVTGAITDHGPLIVPRARLCDTPLPEPQAILPLVLADWLCNRSPEDAFRTGFAAHDEALPQDPLSRDRLALAAAIGADAAYGPWWLLGAAQALLARVPVDAAWAEARALTTPDALDRRLAATARLVRVTHGLPLHPLTAEQSRLVKEIAPKWPDTAAYERIANLYDSFGPAGQTVAARYRRAGIAIWGEGPERGPERGAA